MHFNRSLVPLLVPDAQLCGEPWDTDPEGAQVKEGWLPGTLCDCGQDHYAHLLNEEDEGGMPQDSKPTSGKRGGWRRLLRALWRWRENHDSGE